MTDTLKKDPYIKKIVKKENLTSTSLQIKRSSVPPNMLQIIQAKCEISHINKIVVQSSIVIYSSPIKANP